MQHTQKTIIHLRNCMFHIGSYWNLVTTKWGFSTGVDISQTNLKLIKASPQIYINFIFTELHFQATFCCSVLGRDWQLPQLSLHQTRLKRSRQGVQRHPSQTWKDQLKIINQFKTSCPVCWLLYLVIRWKENVQRTNVSTQTFCINFVLWINTYYCWKNQYLFDIIFESVTDVAGLIVNGSEPLYKKVNEISRQEEAVHLCFTHYSSELPVVRCALWVR